MADYDAIVKALGQTWPARMAKSAAEALMLPGDVYQGNVSMYGDDGRTNPEVIGRSADLAGLVTGGSYAAPAMKDASGMGIRAYHGSPHDFDRFDMSKLGTGEGAQVYGHGLYFAENPTTAQAYRDALELRKSGPGRPSYETPEYSARSILDSVGGDPQRAIAEIEKRRESVRGLDPRFRAAGSEEKFQAVLDILKEGKPLGGGKMYEVNINADPAHLLDWEGKLGQQPQAVKDALAKQLEQFGPDAKMQSQMMIAGSRNPQGLRGVTQDLADRGVPGIKYLDQGSRGAGEGSSNYVVFNDKLIEIMKKYGIALPASGAAAAALYDPNKT